MAATLASATPAGPSSTPNAAATGALEPATAGTTPDHHELHQHVDGGDHGQAGQQGERGVAPGALRLAGGDSGASKPP